MRCIEHSQTLIILKKSPFTTRKRYLQKFLSVKYAIHLSVLGRVSGEKSMRMRLLVIFWVFFFGTSSIFTQDENDIGTVHLMFPSQSVAPGSDVEGIIKFKLMPEWHTYWKNPGDSGLAPSFDWELPHGIKLKALEWPTPSLIKQGDSSIYGYEGAPEWLVRLHFDDDLSAGSFKIRLTSFFLMCDGMCTPLTSQSEYTFTVTPSAPRNIEWNLAEVTTSKLPIPLSSGEAKVEGNTLSLTLPLAEEETALAQDCVLFPENQGLFSPSSALTWKKEETSFSVCIPLAPKGTDLLREKEKFSGLIQLAFKNTKKTFSFSVPVTYIATEPVRPSEPRLWKEKDLSSEKLFANLPSSMVAILFAAFIGGLLLNVTPCVLPVIGLRLLHLLSFRDKGRPFIHGIIFTLGILSAFWTLAGGLYFFQNMGHMIGWGFQLQQPFFVVALIIILFIFSMNLFGVFEIGTSLAGWAGEIESSLTKTPSYVASFINGIIATLIATPCTGPLLGSVLGFAATFDARDGFYLFSAIGLGMASPFLFVTLCPPLLRIIPRPGAWMVGLKQFFGFCLLGTILWLLWVLKGEVRSLSILFICLSFFLLALGSWIFGRWGTAFRSVAVRSLSSMLAFIFMLSGMAALLLSFDSQLVPIAEKLAPKFHAISWKPYSRSALEMELKKGKTVFVDFSAKWCLTCQVNRVIFINSRVVEAFQKNNIVALHADWTNGDVEITEMLRSLGRNGVPVYAIFKNDKEPLLLPEILSPDIVTVAIDASKS